MLTTSTSQLLAQISADRLRQHIQALEGIRHRMAAPQALEKAAAYICAAFQDLNYPVALLPFSLDDQLYHNLLATRPGTNYPDEHVLVIAHFDSVAVTPGADDNASGIAAMLELARIFQAQTFQRTVHFAAVNLEERQIEGASLDETGLFGSRALAAYARQNDWQVKGAIVYDTIAYAGEDKPQQFPPGLPIQAPASGNFIAVIGNQASAALVQGYAQAIQQYQIPLPLLPLVVPSKGEALPDTRRSDHAPFWDAGYTAILLTDTANFRNPHYHQPTDTLDTLNLDFAAQVARATGGLIAALAEIGESTP